jgi:hypothetical protein
MPRDVQRVVFSGPNTSRNLLTELPGYPIVRHVSLLGLIYAARLVADDADIKNQEECVCCCIVLAS